MIAEWSVSVSTSKQVVIATFSKGFIIPVARVFTSPRTGITSIEAHFHGV